MNPVTYTMLDLKGLDLASVKGQSYPGLYNSIYAAMNRCQEIILCNWFVADILIPPTYCLLDIDEYNVISINNKVFIYSDDTIEIPDMGTNPRILELNVTQNGEYTVPVNYDGFNPVHVDVQPPLEEITITENGEYLPSEGYYGIGKVTVSTSTGVPVLTRAAWNALTTAQKQSYGLLAIQDTDSGFLRGELVNGADYIASLLINSVAADVLTEAFAEMFASGNNKWGAFDILGSVASKDGDAVRFAGAWASYSLPASDTPVTVYCVFRQDPVQSGDLAVVGVPYAESGGQNPAFYSRNGTLMRSTYGSADTSIGLSASDNYHVLTLVCDHGTSYYYADGVLKGSMSYYNSGSIVGLAGSVNGARKIQGLYLYAAVVNGAESGNVVIANQQSIMAHYEIE